MAVDNNASPISHSEPQTAQSLTFELDHSRMSSRGPTGTTTSHSPPLVQADDIAGTSLAEDFVSSYTASSSHAVLGDLVDATKSPRFYLVEDHVRFLVCSPFGPAPIR
jgi:hypothetical protein